MAALPLRPGAQRGRHLFGVLLLIGSTVTWSTAGLFVRALKMDTWSIVGWRSLFACLSLFMLAFALRGRALLRIRQSIGPGGAATIPLMAISIFSYIAALNLTSVANVMVIFATVPFIATGLAFLLLHEMPTRLALIASGIAFVGVVIMALAERGASDLVGNGFACLMTLGFAGSLVIARRWGHYDVMLVAGIGNAICAVACFGVIWTLGGAVPRPSSGQLALLLLFSLVTQNLGYIFFLIGSRHVPSSKTGLIALVEVVLAPLWVWLVFSEEPGAPAVIGGTLVLVAVTAFLIAPGVR